MGGGTSSGERDYLTPELDRAIDDLRREFPADFANRNIIRIGVTNCRTKNNKPGGPWSEHAWSNAGDIMLRNWPGRKALGDRIAAYMRSRPDLWSEVFWWIQAHFDHVHGTAKPRRNPDNKQVPPCAGGPIEPDPPEDDDMPPPSQWTRDDWNAFNRNVGWGMFAGKSAVEGGRSTWQTLNDIKALVLGLRARSVDTHTALDALIADIQTLPEEVVDEIRERL
jgi:hypothetical protein